MGNALKFVVFDMDSCQSQWKQLIVTNFLFGLIHFHSSFPSVLEGVLPMEDELIIMSSLFGLTNFHSSFPSVLEGVLSMEEKLLHLLLRTEGGAVSAAALPSDLCSGFACGAGAASVAGKGLVNPFFDLTQLQIINSLFDSILSHSFYLEIIAVSIFLYLLILTKKFLLRQSWPRPRPRPYPPAPPNTPEPGQTPNQITYSSITGISIEMEKLRYPSPGADIEEWLPVPPNTPEPQPGQPQPGQPQPGQPQPQPGQPQPQPGQGQGQPQPQPGQGQPQPQPGQGQGIQTTSSTKEAVYLLGGKFNVLGCLGLTLQKLNFVVKNLIFNLSKIINIDTLYNYMWGKLRYGCCGACTGKALFFFLFFLLILILGYIWNITNLITNPYNLLLHFISSYEKLGELDSTRLILALYPTCSLQSLSQPSSAYIAIKGWGERVESTCHPFFIKLISWCCFASCVSACWVGSAEGKVLQGGLEGFMKKNVTTATQNLSSSGTKVIAYIVFWGCCLCEAGAEGLISYYNITFSFEGQTPFIKMSKSRDYDNNSALNYKGNSSGEKEIEKDTVRTTDTVQSTKNVQGSYSSTTSLPASEDYSAASQQAATSVSAAPSDPKGQQKQTEEEECSGSAGSGSAFGAEQQTRDTEEKNPASNSPPLSTTTTKEGGYADAVVENEGGEKTKTNNSQLGLGYWSDFDWSRSAAEEEEEKKNLEQSKTKEEKKSDDYAAEPHPPLRTEHSSLGKFNRKTEPEQETEYDGDVEDFKASDTNSDSDSDSLNVQAPNIESDFDSDSDSDSDSYSDFDSD
jgi:hypothetical protein